MVEYMFSHINVLFKMGRLKNFEHEIPQGYIKNHYVPSGETG